MYIVYSNEQIIILYIYVYIVYILKCVLVLSILHFYMMRKCSHFTLINYLLMIVYYKSFQYTYMIDIIYFSLLYINTFIVFFSCYYCLIYTIYVNNTLLIIQSRKDLYYNIIKRIDLRK